MTGAARILGDWGTSRLRLFRMDGQAVDARIDGPGIGTPGLVAADALTEALAAWQPVASVALCGMAGARGALVEAGYVACPADVTAWARGGAVVTVAGVPVTVAAGMSCRHADGAPDVMRGEETQIFGALSLDPALAAGTHRLLLPGTHAKWAEVTDGTVTGFRTYPTGELYALLTRYGTLARGAAGTAADEAEGFAAGLDRAGPTPIATLFEARAAQMLDGRGADWARGFLSGLLIGHEIAVEAGDGRAVVLVGDRALSDRYARALSRRDVPSRWIDGDAAALAGLHRLEGLTR